MSRNLLIVLSLATGVVLANNPGLAQAQAKTQAAPRRAENAPAKTKEAQAQTNKAEAKAELAQVRTEPVQAMAEVTPEHTNGEGKTDEAKLTPVPGGKALGMSILGNQEAPKSLVIVPWKSSELGRSPGISTMLDDSRKPVDKDVFMRALRYYEIREAKP